MTLRPVNTLRAMQAGTVSLSMTGDEVVIALARALNLDTDGYQARSHSPFAFFSYPSCHIVMCGFQGILPLPSQVVGRVRKGLEIVEALNDVAVGPDSIPFQKVSIVDLSEA